MITELLLSVHLLMMLSEEMGSKVQVFLSTLIYEDCQGKRYSPRFLKVRHKAFLHACDNTRKQDIRIISIESFKKYISAG